MEKEYIIDYEYRSFNRAKIKAEKKQNISFIVVD